MESLDSNAVAPAQGQEGAVQSPQPGETGGSGAPAEPVFVTDAKGNDIVIPPADMLEHFKMAEGVEKSPLEEGAVTPKQGGESTNEGQGGEKTVAAEADTDLDAFLAKAPPAVREAWQAQQERLSEAEQIRAEAEAVRVQQEIASGNYFAGLPDEIVSLSNENIIPQIQQANTSFANTYVEAYNKLAAPMIERLKNPLMKDENGVAVEWEPTKENVAELIQFAHGIVSALPGMLNEGATAAYSRGLREAISHAGEKAGATQQQTWLEQAANLVYDKGEALGWGEDDARHAEVVSFATANRGRFGSLLEAVTAGFEEVNKRHQQSAEAAAEQARKEATMKAHLAPTGGASDLAGGGITNEEVQRLKSSNNIEDMAKLVAAVEAGKIPIAAG